MLRVVEIMIDRSEANIGNFVDIFELMEDVLSDAFRSDPFLVGSPFRLEFVDNLLDVVHVYISLVDGFSDAALNL